MSTNELINSIDEQTLANIMSKRHKLARAQFKNPPQPKFCIKERTSDGQECFINVLSYSRIANKLSEFDPVSCSMHIEKWELHSYAFCANFALQTDSTLRRNANQIVRLLQESTSTPAKSQSSTACHSTHIRCNGFAWGTKEVDA